VLSSAVVAGVALSSLNVDCASGLCRVVRDSGAPVVVTAVTGGRLARRAVGVGVVSTPVFFAGLRLATARQSFCVPPFPLLFSLLSPS
jgi:hypothetical protein